MFQQLVKYLDENNLLSPDHHGSRQGHNTATALIQLTDMWIEASEKKKLSGVCMIDQSALYDLICKLKVEVNVCKLNQRQVTN